MTSYTKSILNSTLKLLLSPLHKNMWQHHRSSGKHLSAQLLSTCAFPFPFHHNIIQTLSPQALLSTLKTLHPSLLQLHSPNCGHESRARKFGEENQISYFDFGRYRESIFLILMLLEKKSLYGFSISTTSLGMKDQLLGTRKVGVTKMICRFSMFFVTSTLQIQNEVDMSLSVKFVESNFCLSKYSLL
nr:uncharacterized protein LOC104644877 [Solanum lycopersicum]